MDIGIDLSTILQAGMAQRLAIDLVCVLVLIRVIYHRTYKRTDLFLTFFSLNLIVFLIAYVLGQSELGMGAALYLVWVRYGRA